MKIYTALDEGQLYFARESAQPTTLLHGWVDGPQSVLEFITATAANQAAWQTQATAARLNASAARWSPPVRAPSKILCVGRNYADHAAETGAAAPAEPLFFSKLPTTLVGHGDEIRLPSESQQIDFEAELVAVIGLAGRHISVTDALEHVAGYTCGNDVTARDWQKNKPGGQWLLGKSFDTFAPLGPCFVTADEIPDPQALMIQTRLNGQLMQDANTREMLFPLRQLIAYISSVCTLLPGDLIFTGTPAGVGVARQPQVFLQPGDEVTVEIERIGCLTNRVVQGDAGP